MMHHDPGENRQDGGKPQGSVGRVGELPEPGGQGGEHGDTEAEDRPVKQC